MLNSLSNPDLKSLCQNATNTDGDEFVGIKFDWNTHESRYDIRIRFPLGYCIGNDNETIRKDILLLIRTLSTYNDKQSIISASRLSNTIKTVAFPIQAYLNVMYDYLNRGSYYIERDEVYTRRSHGKVNWNRTIREEKPIIQKNGVAYLTMQVRKYNDNPTLNIFRGG